MKTLITVASVAATLGGWAVFAGQPLPAATADPAAAAGPNAPPAASTPAASGQPVIPAQPTPQTPGLGNSGNGSAQAPFQGRRGRLNPSNGGSTQPSTGSSLPAPFARSRSSR